MKIVELVQGSPEWISYRRNVIGGSDAPSVMNCGYLTPYQLYMQKLGLYEQPVSAAMMKGHELEPIARANFEETFGVKTRPCVVEHSTRSWQIASLDGLTEDGNVFVEIKTGGEAARKRAVAGEVSDTNYCQIQHQLEVTGLKQAFLFFFDGINGYPIEIKRDEAYIERLNVAEERFWRDLQNFKAPSMTERDKVVRETEARLRMATEWLELTERMRKDEERKKQLLDQLLQESDYQNTTGCGVQLTRVVRPGSVDYSAIPELKGVNLDAYRKAPTEYWKVSKI